MNININLLNDIYNDFYDFPYYYLGIDNEKYCNIFAILFIIFLCLSLIFIIRIRLDISKNRNEMKTIKRSIDKIIINFLEDKNKKNIL